MSLRDIERLKFFYFVEKSIGRMEGKSSGCTSQPLPSENSFLFAHSGVYMRKKCSWWKTGLMH